MSPRRQQLDAIVGLSRGMLEMAEASEWEALAGQEQTRVAMLKAFFEEAVAKSDAPYVRQGIEEMLAINGRIVKMGEAARVQLQESMSALNNGKRASAAYARNVY